MTLQCGAVPTSSVYILPVVNQRATLDFLPALGNVFDLQGIFAKVQKHAKIETRRL